MKLYRNPAKGWYFLELESCTDSGGFLWRLFLDPDGRVEPMEELVLEKALDLGILVKVEV